MAMRLNLGCGSDYRDGWLNVDSDPDVRADMHCDMVYVDLPPASVSQVVAHHSFEHVPTGLLPMWLGGIARACLPDATVEIWTPHYTSISAHAPFHHSRWCVQSFDALATFPSLRPFPFTVERIELHFWKEGTRYWLSPLRLERLNANWFWNLGQCRGWQRMWERFNVFGFDEIYYRLRRV